MTVHYCALSQQLVSKSRAGVRDGDPTNDLTFLRIRSKKNEIMIAPGGYLPVTVPWTWNFILPSGVVYQPFLFSVSSK